MSNSPKRKIRKLRRQKKSLNKPKVFSIELDWHGLCSTLVILVLLIVFAFAVVVDLFDGVLDPNNAVLYTGLFTCFGTALFRQKKLKRQDE